MIADQPVMHVSTWDGDVTIAVSPDVARSLGAVWATAHANDPARDKARPRWHDDVVALFTAATQADEVRGVLPAPSYARLLPTQRPPALSVVREESQA